MVASCPVMKGIEEDGVISEAISFETLMKTIEKDEPDYKDLMEELPPLVSLMRQVHKHAWWNGAEFGRLVFVKLDEAETIRENG